MATKDVRISIPSDIAAKPSRAAPLFILGIDISKFSHTVQFCISSAGVFIFFIIYGYIMELMFRFEAFRPFGWYLTWVQFAIYTGLAAFELQVMKTVPETKRRLPMQSFFILSVLTVATMGLSNSSLGYLNYPTQVIFKSCKLIPTMLGGIIIQGKRYGVVDFVAVVCMSAGLALFTLADSSVQPNFDPYGVLLISLALCADGAIGNFQEKEMKSLGVSNVEIVFYSYGIGFFILLAGLISSGQLVPAFVFCAEHPLRTYGLGLLFSATGYVGVQFVLALVQVFGALTAVTVTTCRKSMSIMLSFLLFTKPFTLQYLWSGLLVVVGIYLSLYAKQRARWDLALRGWYSRLARPLPRPGAWRGPSTVV